MQIIYGILGLIAIGAMLWLSFTLFIFLAVFGAIAFCLLAVYRFLLVKKIINPIPGATVHTDTESTRITVIDAEYTREDDKISRD